MLRQVAEIEQWNRYWAYGNLHSFSQVREGNYRGVLADFWQSRFRQLAAGSRILDIATGNGAIALLAREESDRLSRDFEIVGVDLADIDPVSQVKDPSLASKLQRIRFHGRTPAESLPFENGSIDLVCSQFGVEYGDLSRSIPEIARVLRAGGRFAAVVHHRESALLSATREELGQLDFVLNEVKLYLRARNLLRAMAAARQGGGGRKTRPKSAKIERKREALQEAMSRIQKAAGMQINPNMLLGPARYVREILSATHRVDAVKLLDWLEEARLRVKANQRRLMDMTEAARDDEDLRGIAQRLGANGLIGVESGQVHEEDGALVGWWIEADKDGGITD